MSRKEVWLAWFWAQRAPQSTSSTPRLSQSWTASSCPLPQSFSVSLVSTMSSFAYSSLAGCSHNTPLQCIGKTKLCRDGALCLLKRGWPSAKLLCQLDSQPVGLLRREKNIIIACMDQTLMCLTNKVCHPAYTPPTLCDRASECGSKSCRRPSLVSSRWTSPVVASA